MNPTLYNPKTGITATPNANVTPIQQSSAMSQGFAPISSNSSSSPITVDMIGARPLALPNITSPIPTTITVNPPQGTQIDTNGNAIVNPTNTTTTTEPTKSNYQKILESIGLANDKLATKGDVTTQLQNDLQLAQRTENAVADYNAYNKKKLEVQQTINSMYDKTGGTTAGTQEAINNYSRRENANLANLAIIAQSSQGLLDSARQTIKDKVEAQFQPIQDQIDYLTRYAQLNQNDLSEKEKYQLEQQANQKKTDLANITKTAGDLHQNMLSNKAPQSVYTALDKITNDYIAGKITATDAQSKMYQAVGSYGTDPKIQIEKDNAILQGQKLRQEILSNQPASGEFASVINGAAGLVANTKKQQVKNNISNALANGNFENAYAEVANAVSDGLTGTPKTKFDDARTDMGIMKGMRKAIQDYSNAGGDMGLLTGTEEQIKRKLGIDSGKASALATQLWREFQTYRSNMTGAAFTPNESRDYAAVNPTLGKSLDLNLSVIDGAINQLDNRITSTVNARIPDAKKIYDLAYKTSNMQQTVKVNNQEWQIGTIYEDAKGNRGTFDINGNWIPQK